MNYNRKIMRLELSAEKALNGGYYYAELLLPAADYEIKDAMQRTRAVGRENTVEVSILECDILPELQDIRLDTFSLDELNFLAKRLVSLTDEEMPVFSELRTTMDSSASRPSSTAPTAWTPFPLLIM